MRFGPVPIDEALGATLAHAVKAGRRLKKGHVLTPDDLDRLREAGHREVIVARLDADDIAEDRAARAIAAALGTATIVAEQAATGRCNLHATRAGLFLADRTKVDALNAVHPGITLATLADAEPVEAGRLVATVKIIPLAVPRDAVEKAAAAAGAAIELRPFRALRVAMISTVLDTLKPSVIDKTERLTRARVDALGSRLVGHRRVAHEAGAVADALAEARGADLAIVFGASAVTDAQDVIPAAIRLAGGTVGAVGMPVDPGNLLCVGALDGMDVIGAPGCARSPALNGFDWVLHRLAAGLNVDAPWLRSLGVGGLLMEIVGRPSPREPLAVVVLAAGRSTRMGAENKLAKPLDGKPLVAHAVDAALEAGIGPVTVVTGHEAESIEAALAGRDVTFVHNADFAEGMSTSLRRGLEAVDAAAGAMIVLGDMPDVSSDAIRALAAAFHEHDMQRIVVARDTSTGRRGNPVVWPSALFGTLRAIEGDRGARDVLREREADLVAVKMEGAALDLDTPAAFAERLSR